MPGRRQIGTCQARKPAIGIEKWHGQPRLKTDPVERSNGFEETDGRVVTPHKEVLAVVHDRARDGIDKRARPTAQVWFLFQQLDALPRLSQRHTRRQSGKAATDNENVRGHFGFWILDSTIHVLRAWLFVLLGRPELQEHPLQSKI
jgi:hypothetical protein